MTRILHRCLLTGGSLLALGGTALAQPAPAVPPPPAPAARGPLYNPQQFPAIHGTLAHYTLTPRGDVDGFVMSDGTEVHFPPPLSSALVYTVHPGDAVTVHGLKAMNLPMVAAVSVTNDRTGQTVVDNGPSGPPGPGAVPMQTLSVQGTVQTVLHGPRGEVNGAMLQDGTILRLPPPEAARFAALLEPGAQVAAQGSGPDSPLGKVIVVTAFGPGPDQLSTVRQPPRPPHGHRHPPRPGPGPGGDRPDPGPA